MNAKLVLEQAQALLKAAKENPEQFQELEKKYMGFKAVENAARESGARNPAAVAAAAGRKKYGKKAFQAAAASGHKMNKTFAGDLSLSEDGKSKHDRCVEHVEENSPEVKNPHAVCVAEGVKPAAWKKNEMDKHDADGDTGEIQSEKPMKKDAITDAMGVANSEKPMSKDDMPHPPNSPEDKAHDVSEHSDTIHHAMKILDTPERQKAMLAHLRTLHDPSQARSEKNKEAGMAPGEKKMDKAEMLKAAKDLLELAKNEPQKFEELTKGMAAPAPAENGGQKAMEKSGADGKPMNANQIYPPAKKTGMRMTKEEIKADMAKPWEPKHKKMEGC